MTQPSRTFRVDRTLSHRGWTEWRHSQKVGEVVAELWQQSLHNHYSAFTSFDRLAAAFLRPLCVNV